MVTNFLEEEDAAFDYNHKTNVLRQDPLPQQPKISHATNYKIELMKCYIELGRCK